MDTPLKVVAALAYLIVATYIGFQLYKDIRIWRSMPDREKLGGDTV